MSDYIDEASTPLLFDPSCKRNLTDFLADRVAAAPDHLAFRIRPDYGLADGPLTGVSTREFYDLVTSMAKGLLAVGVQQGDTLGLQGPTSYLWAVADMASLWVGAIVVPIFDTAAPEQVRFTARDSGMTWAFAGTDEQCDTLREVLVENVPSGRVWRLDLKDGGMGDLIRMGCDVSVDDLEARRVAAVLDDTATLVYTSGTEGRPKGVLLTHRNLIGRVGNIGADYAELVHSCGRTLIFLPLAHVLARALQLICLAEGMTISYEADPAKAVASLTEVRPTFLVVVPRVLQKIRERIAATAAEKKLGWLWSHAEKTAIARGRHIELAQTMPHLTMPAALRVKQRLFDRLFFRRVRELLGGDIDYVLTGAAPLGEEMGLLFRGMGVEVIEGYGLTETTAPLTGNRPGANYSGTVGRPEPGHTVRISNDGEILAKGVGVSPGYWHPRDNEAAFIDGFLRTGDLGSLDEAGRLTITGRVKEAIVTAGGKTIFPHLWQQDVETEPLVAHAVVVGDSRPYPAALILVDGDELHRLGLTDDHSSPAPTVVNSAQILDRVATSLRRANERVSGPERVKRFRVLAVDLTPGGEMVTPTMKLRRSWLLEAMAPAIDDLYVNGVEVG